MHRRIILVAMLVFAVVLLAAAQVPHTMSFQGYYTSNGQPFTGTYPMAFKLYTQANGGSSVWTQSFGSVPIVKGVYSVVLDVSAVTFNKKYYLETTINNVVSSNRTELTGAPYSLAPWASADSNTYFNGGNVGVGTNTPLTQLDVRGNLTLDPGTSPVLYTGTGSVELNRYLNLINAPAAPSASGLKAGGILVSDSYSWGNPGKNDLLVRGSLGVGINSPDRKVTVQGLASSSGGAGSFMNFKLGYAVCCPTPVELLVGADDAGGIISTESNNDLLLGAGGNHGAVVLKPNGNIGVGISNPQAGIDINKFPNLRLRNPFGSAFYDIYATDSYLHLPNLILTGGNIGIGTFSPTADLDVVGRTKTQVLEITGGSDLAEPFDVESDTRPDAGTVVIINPDKTGTLTVSHTAYDPRVAGIISGAGGITPGITLRQAGKADGAVMVAIAGRVYCKAEAFSSPIEAGDLLTTSAVPGHAMKAIDKNRSQGTVLGKAMSSLKGGTGLVLVLVNLQ